MKKNQVDDVTFGICGVDQGHALSSCKLLAVRHTNSGLFDVVNPQLTPTGLLEFGVSVSSQSQHFPLSDIAIFLSVLFYTF